ncbi:hypothetical protein T265_10124 [Opisthorchis viverrini]|uniref:Uncharacterized protein n=1 Tax=Opisthorchis viverrini TaxID=6198 RepID=A0A074Z3I7_OPIVI|nr:hypothetical protein T265_10124 [Opisthorchis viverrini]KER21588.1 hypothetical protein T265_10124 [Opisthorchis viverrini]
MRRFLRLAADGSDNLRWSKVGLAKEVLAELPSQENLIIRRSFCYLRKANVRKCTHESYVNVFSTKPRNNQHLKQNVFGRFQASVTLPDWEVLTDGTIDRHNQGMLLGCRSRR